MAVSGSASKLLAYGRRGFGADECPSPWRGICGGGRLRSVEPICPTSQGGSPAGSAIALEAETFTELVGLSFTAPISAKLGMGIFCCPALAARGIVPVFEMGDGGGGLELAGCGMGVLVVCGTAGGLGVDGSGNCKLDDLDPGGVDEEDLGPDGSGGGQELALGSCTER